ncbi:hypothetical protein RP726_05635 [Candidatus Methylospira mobilis]|uniref:hypothetical protein n=1 Tax=Candidatus Methylospira mobilis TaxID=1808979 RepID=UPI0028ECFE3D|nr:hypothetical protein [Candidatus Methylospira mobilis]WNV05893.1 hypothetical protein RP726_05635 [Candidatus Methylospira mobilis]
MAGAAEGKVVANLFAPAGDWDVPAGFAKNGDTLHLFVEFLHPLRDREQCEASGSSSPRKL